MDFGLCAPALLNVGFSLAQIIIDLYKQMYNTALLKFIIMIIFTIILNILCEMGYAIISWFIVFIPFIFITVITTILLFVFGLDPKSGKYKYNVEYPEYYNPDNHTHNSQELNDSNNHDHNQDKNHDKKHKHKKDHNHHQHHEHN